MSDPVGPAALQFDKAISVDPNEASASGVVCAQCGTRIVDSYFTLAQKPFCTTCTTAFEQVVARTRTPGTFAKAVVFGLGAAIAGAIVYYAVIAILNVEIGIVSILIGYMVGYAIRKATSGVGSRQYQILAAALTYLAVGMAYMPLLIRGAAPVETLLFSAITLPVRMVIDSGASGLLSAAIIAFGMRQAWRMTAAPNLSFVGPLKVAPSGASVSASPA